MVDWKTIATVAQIGEHIIDDEKRDKLLSKLKRLFRQNRRIIVFGISGAGKSQFMKSLKHKLDIPERTRVSDNPNFELEDFPIVFMDTPGHSEHSYERKKAINEIIKNGVEGIINVVSYGFEETPEHGKGDAFLDDGTVRESFLKINRVAEIDRLGEWLPLIEPKQIGWIITLVNKADLWWDRQEAVNDYYSDGEYNSRFTNIKSFTHVLALPYCSIIKPYYDESTSGRFGELHKIRLFGAFMHELLNLIKEEDC